ncbi:MAG: hypothetical protein KKC79_20110 [Gammaproteobacteria bacterium]|nr:hypothetical protein [Gammaproteobacteria bacterium]MBU1443291.1 hypothetical protein [Gammaproteobacteria bacterium]MBU2285090.1 hypothetical protein [Gammaproteobacteria bacterium]MBU2410941.1 hypothetical protein [Gammaproteobacteria bacterium]
MFGANREGGRSFTIGGVPDYLLVMRRRPGIGYVHVSLHTAGRRHLLLRGGATPKRPNNVTIRPASSTSIFALQMSEFMNNLRGAGDLPTLRRCLFVMLLLIVPFQFAWSAASVYCGHEAGAGAPHFGHHEHHTKVHAGDKTQGAKLKQIVDADDNCVGCHASLAQQSASVESPMIVLRSVRPHESGPPSYRSPVPPALERPARQFSS